MCAEVTLPFRAAVQQLWNSPAKKSQVFSKKYFWPAGKVAKAHERNFYECPFE